MRVVEPIHDNDKDKDKDKADEQVVAAVDAAHGHFDIVTGSMYVKDRAESIMKGGVVCGGPPGFLGEV